MWLLVSCLMVANTNCQQSSQYLHSAVRDLRKLNNVHTLKRLGTAAADHKSKLELQVQTSARRAHQGNEVPPLGLTKGELSALYQSAIAKGETLKLDTGDDSFIHAAVHEIDDLEGRPNHYEPQPQEYENHQTYESPEHATESEDDSDGYYYYYYPLKAFMDELSSQPSSSAEYTYKPKTPKPGTTVRPHYQFHSHHHQHNITINKGTVEDMKKEKSPLEPLFMAISGFIGMAVMFVLSVLVLPKFSSKPNKTKLLPIKKTDSDFEDFARLAIDAIENRECAERFACELSKTARTFNLQENRFIKLLKRMAPGTFGKHIDRVEKYRNKQLKCTAIPCKKRSNSKTNNNTNTQKKKNVVKRKH